MAKRDQEKILLNLLKNRKHLLILPALFSLIFTSACAGSLATDEDAHTRQAPFTDRLNLGPAYQVISVADGDTLSVKIGGKIQRIRLIGTDTPETRDPRKKIQCFGREASTKTKQLTENTTVRLAPDPTQGNKDRFGRLLRYVVLRDGTLLNHKLIAEGYAYEYTFRTPYLLQSDFKEAETSARTRRLGLWAEEVCNGERNRPPFPSSTSSKDQLYASCEDVRLAGAAPLRKGQPGYRTALDRDGDGIACE